MVNRTSDKHSKALHLVVALLLCWFIRLDQIVFGEIEISTLGNDSDQFLSAAGYLLDSHVPLVSGVARHDSGLEIRTPAYPVLLTLPLLMARTGFPLSKAIAILHAVLLLITLVCLSQLLKGWLKAYQTALATLLSALLMRQYFFMLIAEWQAFCLLLLFLGAASQLYRDKNHSMVMLTFLLASAATLTRPDYIVLIAIATGIMVLRGLNTLPNIRNAMFGVLPLIFLLSINLYRFNRLTLAPAEGHLFALLSSFSSQPEIEGLVTQCLMPGVAIPPLQTNLVPTAVDMLMLEPRAQLDSGCANLKSLSDAFYSAGYTDWNKTNSCLLHVSGGLLKIHIGSYFKNYLYSLLTLLWATPLVLFIRQRSKSEESSASRFSILFLIAFATHVVHVAFVSAVNLMHFRYYIVTFSPLITPVLMTYLSVLNKKNTQP